MKERIRTSLLASFISAAMCLTLAGCSRGPTGESASSNSSATNANSSGQSDAAAATSSEQATAPLGEDPATDASKGDPLAGSEAGKTDPLANVDPRKSDPLASADPKKPDSLTGADASKANSTPSAATHDEKPPPPRTYTIAAGRPISIHTSNTLSTKANRAGDSFVGTLANAIVDRDWVIAKRGATVHGVVTNSDPGGKVKGVASLTLVVKRLQLADGRNVEVSTSSFTREAKTTTKKDAIKIGGGAVAGAVIGAIVGGKKGAAIGAGVGGGAGTGAVLATRGDPATIPAETALTFRLRAPVTVVKR
ncbi:MAG: hypothetical protein AABO41_08545 [Acidobacteriota bacterium]